MSDSEDKITAILELRFSTRKTYEKMHVEKTVEKIFMGKCSQFDFNTAWPPRIYSFTVFFDEENYNKKDIASLHSQIEKLVGKIDLFHGSFTDFNEKYFLFNEEGIYRAKKREYE